MLKKIFLFIVLGLIFLNINIAYSEETTFINNGDLDTPSTYNAVPTDTKSKPDHFSKTPPNTTSGIQPDSAVGARLWTDSNGDKWYYTLSSSKATIVAYIGDEVELTIPTSVGGYTVSKVSWCNRPSNYMMPETTDQGMGFLYGNTTVRKVTIPPAIDLDREAFQYSMYLEEIVVQKSITRLEYAVFGDCYSLNKISGLNKVTYLDGASLALTNKLTETDLNWPNITHFAGLSLYNLSSKVEPENYMDITVNGFVEKSGFSGTRAKNLTLATGYNHNVTDSDITNDKNDISYAHITNLYVNKSLDKSTFYECNISNVFFSSTVTSINKSFTNMWKAPNMIEFKSNNISITNSFEVEDKYGKSNITFSPNSSVRINNSFNKYRANADISQISNLTIVQSAPYTDFKFVTDVLDFSKLNINYGKGVITSNDPIVDVKELFSNTITFTHNRIQLGEVGSELRRLVKGKTYVYNKSKTLNQETLHQFVKKYIELLLTNGYQFPDSYEDFNYSVDGEVNKIIDSSTPKFTEKIIDFPISKIFNIRVTPSEKQNVTYGDSITYTILVTCNDPYQQSADVKIQSDNRVIETKNVLINTPTQFTYEVGRHITDIVINNKVNLEFEVVI